MSHVLDGLSPQRRAVVEAIYASREPLGAKELAQLVASSEESIRQMFTPLVEAGLITKTGRGRYWKPDSENVSVRESRAAYERMGPPMQPRPSMADFVGHPDVLTEYDRLGRAGRAVVAEARDATGQIVYAVRVEFLVRLAPEQIGMSYGVEEGAMAGTT